jgi:hypothetical protein
MDFQERFASSSCRSATPRRPLGGRVVPSGREVEGAVAAAELAQADGCVPALGSNFVAFELDEAGVRAA